MNNHDILKTYYEYLSRCSMQPLIHPTNTLVGNILKRLVFIDYIDLHISDYHKIGIDNQFIKSMQAFLLLSSSDALGKTLYHEDKLVKKRFMEFWEKRTDRIKTRIVLCYYPYLFSCWETKYKGIIESFYNDYRNPFTHTTISNVPPIYSVKSKQGHAIGQIMAIGFTDNNNNKNIIDIPLLEDEATDIIKIAKRYYWILDNGKKGRYIQIKNVSDLLRLNIEVCSYKNELDSPNYVHNGLIKAISMGIIEGYNELARREEA